MATILIIEDHALSRQMLNTWLGYTGHTILKAGSGEERWRLPGKRFRI